MLVKERKEGSVIKKHKKDPVMGLFLCYKETKKEFLAILFKEKLTMNFQ